LGFVAGRWILGPLVVPVEVGGDGYEDIAWTVIGVFGIPLGALRYCQ